MRHFGRASAIKLPDDECTVAADHTQERVNDPIVASGVCCRDCRSPPRSSDAFPGSKESSPPQQAHVTSAPLQMQ